MKIPIANKKNGVEGGLVLEARGDHWGVGMRVKWEIPSRAKEFGAIALASLLIAASAASQEFDYFKEFDYETFTPDDFQKFYGLIEDGKITRDKLNAMCETRPLGFTVEARDVAPETSSARLYYNVSKQHGSIDGRAFRSRYFNASLGEWTGAVFKPICPGLYVFSLDFTAQVSDKSANDVSMHLLLRRRGGDRPGKTIATAKKITSSSRGSGYASAVLILGTGDEVSTFYEFVNSDKDARLESVRLSVYKINHLEELVRELDLDARDRDLKALNAGGGSNLQNSVND